MFSKGLKGYDATNLDNKQGLLERLVYYWDNMTDNVIIEFDCMALVKILQG